MRIAMHRVRTYICPGAAPRFCTSVHFCVCFQICNTLTNGYYTLLDEVTYECIASPQVASTDIATDCNVAYTAVTTNTASSTHIGMKATGEIICFVFIHDCFSVYSVATLQACEAIYECIKSTQVTSIATKTALASNDAGTDEIPEYEVVA